MHNKEIQLTENDLRMMEAWFRQAAKHSSAIRFQLSAFLAYTQAKRETPPDGTVANIKLRDMRETQLRATFLTQLRNSASDK